LTNSYLRIITVDLIQPDTKKSNIIDVCTSLHKHAPLSLLISIDHRTWQRTRRAATQNHDGVKHGVQASGLVHRGLVWRRRESISHGPGICCGWSHLTEWSVMATMACSSPTWLRPLPTMVGYERRRGFIDQKWTQPHDGAPISRKGRMLRAEEDDQVGEEMATSRRTTAFCQISSAGRDRCDGWLFAVCKLKDLCEHSLRTQIYKKTFVTSFSSFNECSQDT
jgi:hypothetical protein